MKASKVLRIAAQRIERGLNVLGCPAVNRIQRDSDKAMHYFNLFKPPRIHHNSVWFGDWLIQENQDCRVLALCFAAAIAESEGQ
jgi:hypothetical protein